MGKSYLRRMISLLRLVRLQHLLLLISVQCFIRYFLMKPLLQSFGYELMLGDPDFFLLVFSTVMIAAAGYVINDYFDLRSDYVNKPARVVVGRGVDRRLAIFLHWVLSATGVILGFYVAWKTGVILLGIVPALCVGLLWFYSTDYKRQFLIGNLVIGILTVIIIAIVPLFEPAFYRLYFSDNKNAALLIMQVLAFYTTIAFLLSLLKAMVKDTIDIEGDAAVHASTLSVRVGKGKVRYILIALAVIIMLLIGYAQRLQIENSAFVAFTYLLLSMQLPLLLACILIGIARHRDQFKRINILLTGIMIAGAVSLPVLYYFS